MTGVHASGAAAAVEGKTTHWPMQLLFGWLNLVLIAPVIFLYIGLPLILRQHGWSGTEIGLLQLAGLPAILKFLLAAPVERVRLGRASYRNWGIVLALCYAVVLFAFGLHDLATTPRWLLFSFALAVNVLATWADVPINALAIQCLPGAERMRAGAVRSAATSLGAIVGGGAMLLIHARLGWQAAFTTLGCGLLSGAALLLLLRHRAAAVQRADTTLTPPVWLQWRGWFAVPRHRAWAWLVLTYVPFIGAAWVYLKPMLLDHGFAPERIAMLVGIVGGLVSALASLAGNRLTRRIGVQATLPLFAASSVLAMSALALALLLQTSAAAFVVAAMAIAISLGATSGLVFGLMMQHTRSGLTALDYGIQSTLFIITRTFVPLLAGLLLDRFGHLGMVCGLLLALIAVTALSLRLRHGVASADANAAP